MFSVLICSINKTFLENVKLNIAQTIGQKFEIIVWDNLLDPKPITEVYNLLASKANYPYWCFIHEDISFETHNWSEKLLSTFEQNPSIGLIGIAGAKYKSRSPSGWSTGILKYDYCNIFHKDKNGQIQHLYNNPTNSIVEPVVNVDGVFMVIRREVWKDANFNSDLLTGFHLYDIDFSLQVFRNWSIAVIFDIDITHFTQGGDYGNIWLKYTLLWHKKFSTHLPVSLAAGNLPKNIENTITKNWLYRLSSENITARNKWKWIKNTNSVFKPGTWPYIGYFLIRRIFTKLK
jgi:hypothetical protein